MISHCIPAAGIAGLIKMALALHHRVLPPTLCDEVNPELGVDETPFYVNTQHRAVDLAAGRAAASRRQRVRIRRHQRACDPRGGAARGATARSADIVARGIVRAVCRHRRGAEHSARPTRGGADEESDVAPG